MSWPASLTVAVLTAAIAGVLAGLVANLCAGWYRISSFEGAAGYWVVAMALLGVLAGGLVGLVASRVLGHAGFATAFGGAALASVALAAGVGGAAWLLADVPPRLDGHELVLLVELRWPTGEPPPVPADGDEWAVRLSALSGSVVRASREGPLWSEDARVEEGRWIVPGVVDVFTHRGRRLVSFSPDSLVAEGFILPLPRRPGAAQRAWSEWLPVSRGGDRFQVRFKVVPDDEPHRSVTIGRFEVAVVGAGYGLRPASPGPARWSSDARFEVRRRGEIVPLGEKAEFVKGPLVDAVAVVEGPRPALVVGVGTRTREGVVVLVTGGLNGAGAEVTPIGASGDGVRAALVTSDALAWDAARNRRSPDGWIDRETFATPGVYLFQDAILDTRTLAVRPIGVEGRRDVIERIPPLGLSPDGLALARLAWAGDGTQVAIRVLDLAGGDASTVPVDRTTMRYAEIDQIDPAWLDHYFEWRRDVEGRDRLRARSGVTPLPHRGVLTLDGSGYREYRIGPAGDGLRAAFEDFLADEFGATKGDADPSAFAHELRIGATVVHVSYRAEDAHVGVWMDRGTDTGLVAEIAARFDTALESGRFDRFFGP